MTTPAELLGSKTWRRKNSRWMIPVIALFGIGTWAGFLYVGITAKRSDWKKAAIIYGASMLPFFIAIGIVSDGDSETTSGAETVLSFPVIAIWAIGIVHAFQVNKQWLNWRAEVDSNAPAPSGWHAGGSASSTLPPPAPSYDDVLRGQFQQGAMPVNHAATADAFAPIDLNTATIQQLQSGLNLDPAVAIRILETRARLGHFSSPEQLMTEAGVQPHVFASVRHRVFASQRTQPTGKPGRRLDL